MNYVNEYGMADNFREHVHTYLKEEPACEMIQLQVYLYEMGFTGKYIYEMLKKMISRGEIIEWFLLVFTPEELS